MDPSPNFARATLSAGIDSDDTGLTVNSASDAARFGTIALATAATHLNAVIWNETDYPNPADDPNREIVRVTNITGQAFTIQRPAGGNSYNGEGSDNTAKAHNTSGKTYKIAAVPSKKQFDDIGQIFTGNMKTRIHPSEGGLQCSPDGGTNWHDIEALAAGGVINLVVNPSSNNS